MKKAIKYLLIILFGIVLFGEVSGVAETSGVDGNISWTLNDDGILTISGNGAMTNYSIYSTSGIPWGVNAKSVVIEEGVTSIGDAAFYKCKSLIDIMIPDSVTSIGDYAFYYCQSLTEIPIPDSVTSIGNNAFDCCKCLTDITIPDSVISIGDYTFDYCQSLTDITIPDSVTSIGSYAFYNCQSLTNITIPDSVISIGSYAFSNCSKLTSITIPNGVPSIRNNAFYGCTSLTSIMIPDSVTSIMNNVFYGCTSLTNITIPDSVTSIGDYAFRDCISLTSITIPDSVTSISSCTFWGCTSLMSFTIPSTVTNIGSYAFYYCDSLKDVFIPDSVTSIGVGAFCYCKTLTSIIIPGGVNSIAKEAFSDCYSLTSATIQNGVTNIGSWAFRGCKSLTSITIPSSVSTIGDHAFSGCYNLKSALIQDGVTTIADHAFYVCESLISVTIPDSVTTIGEYAFSNCYSLRYITIPEHVTSIGSHAFTLCDLEVVAFSVSDRNVSISFGEAIFKVSSSISFLCHKSTSAAKYLRDNGYSVIYFEDIEIESMRSITLPKDFRMDCGESVTLAYAVFPLDGAQVTWTSSDETVLTVQDGTVTAMTKGIATVTATVGSASDSVRIESFVPAAGLILNDSEIWLQAGESTELSIVGFVPENAVADKISWSSSDTELATVDSNGNVTTTLPGEVTITATTERGVEAICLLHLCRPVILLTIEPSECEMLTGDTLQLTATAATEDENYINRLVTFSSSDESVVTVNRTGLVTAIQAGKATVMAVSCSNKTASVEIIVQCRTHSLVSVQTVAPTCTENGYKACWVCSACGKYFRDEEASDEIVAPEAIPALTHEWGPATYVWANDYSSVTASRVCTRDESHEEAETVETTSEITKVATCEDMGETTYTTEIFKNMAFTAQTMVLDNIPALGHNWGEVEYQWSFDNSTITANKVCRNDSNHYESETVDSVVTITSPTDNETGFAIYEGQFENPSFSKQEKSIEIPTLNSMEVIKLPELLRTIDEDAFASISAQAVIIPDCCMTIGSKAFADCPNLIYIWIPKSVTSISDDAFDGCAQVIIDYE